MSLLAARRATIAHRSNADQIDGAKSGAAKDALLQSVRPGLLPRCANPDCRSGWLHLFRRRSIPVFEGGWTCSPECTEARLQSALHRELEDRAGICEVHHHRIPLGLLMLEQGWITLEQLRRALAAQRAVGTGRLGEWLIRQHAADESTVSRGLAIQWSCPVVSPESSTMSTSVSVIPRLFLDAFGVLPLQPAASRLLYLGFEQNLDPALALAVEKMTGLRVESGIVPSSAFRAGHERALNSAFPQLQLGEAVSASAAAHMFARAVERTGPVASRLVRVHDYLWLRMSLSGEAWAVNTVRDVVCVIGKIAA